MRIQANLTFPKESSAPDSEKRQFYVAYHDHDLFALGNQDNRPKWDWRKDLPEVFFCLPEHRVDMTEPIQRLCFDLFRHGAPSMSENKAKDKYRLVYQYNIAFCNKNGFNRAGDPRADFINKRDLKEKLPAFDKPRFCGGALLTGVEDGGDLVIETINPTSLPTLDWLLERPWLYFHAVSVGAKKGEMFPQGLGEPVLVPLIADRPVRYPLAKLKKLSEDYDIATHDAYTYLVE